MKAKSLISIKNLKIQLSNDRSLKIDSLDLLEGQIIAITRAEMAKVKLHY